MVTQLIDYSREYQRYFVWSWVYHHVRTHWNEIYNSDELFMVMALLSWIRP